MSQRPRNADELALAESATRVLPGGFGNAPYDVVIQRGEGGHVFDVSGNRYVDFLLGSGPMLLGHAHPEVIAAVQDQVTRGTTFYTGTPNGIRLAEAIVDAVPCAEKLRFTSTGTEATFFAMRAARAYRKRSKIMKFEGGFHGTNDYAQMSTAPKVLANFPQALPDSAGIPDVIRGEMLIAPFNDADAAASMIEAHRDELGGVIVEPMQRLLPPKPGFLQALREVTEKHDIPLIFDEIVTGFRLAWGGAQEYYGVVPDLCALGKIIGGGFPLAAVAGRTDIMAHFHKGKVSDEAVVSQSGTLNGNPLAAAAGLATLEVLKRPGTYKNLFATGQRLKDGFAARLKAAHIPATVVGEPPLFDVVFAEGDMKDYRATARGDAKRLVKFNNLMLEHGVLKGENKMYVSCAHTEADVDETLQAIERSIALL